jgi:hypothetical protein
MEEGKAIASLDEPVEIERGATQLAIDPAQDKLALATLRKPLLDAEAGAFVGEEDLVSTDDEDEVADESISVASIPAPVSVKPVVEPNRPEPKPVKAGSLDLDEAEAGGHSTVAHDATSKAQLDAAAAVAATKSQGDSQAPKPVPAKSQPDDAEKVSKQPLPEQSREQSKPTLATTSAQLASAPAPIPAAVVESAGMRTMGVSASEPIVGQLVRVLPGDTVWDIAIAYYGTAGPVTLKRILNGNPGIRDPRHLEVGAHIYLPFQRPEQMVLAGAEGSYRVLLAVAPEESRLAPVRAWVESIMSAPRFTTSVVSGAERSFQLHAVGLLSREAAIELATAVLEAHDRRKRPSLRRSA